MKKQPLISNDLFSRRGDPWMNMRDQANDYGNAAIPVTTTKNPQNGFSRAYKKLTGQSLPPSSKTEYILQEPSENPDMDRWTKADFRKKSFKIERVVKDVPRPNCRDKLDVKHTSFMFKLSQKLR